MRIQGETRPPRRASAARLLEEDGATAVEYAILVAFIATVIIGIVGVLGLEIQALFADPDLHDALTP